MSRPLGTDPWEWLRDHPDTESVRIRDTIVSGAHFDLLSSTNQLKYLEFRCCEITSEVATRWPELKLLWWLCLYRCTNIVPALDSLREHPSMTVLSIETEDLTTQLKEALVSHPLVSGLALHNPRGPASGYEFIATMPNLRRLVALEVEETSILEHLRNCIALRSLYLEGHFTHFDIELLANFEGMENLTLSAPDLDPNSLILLGHHPQLTWLDLSRTPLTDNALLGLIESPRLKFITHTSKLISNKVMKFCSARRAALGLDDCVVQCGPNT